MKRMWKFSVGAAVATALVGCADSVSPLTLDQKQQARNVLESADTALAAARGSARTGPVASRLQEDFNEELCVRKFKDDSTETPQTESDRSIEVSEKPYVSYFSVSGTKCSIQFSTRSVYSTKNDLALSSSETHYETKDQDFSQLNDVVSAHIDVNGEASENEYPKFKGKISAEGRLKSTKYGWVLVSKKSEVEGDRSNHSIIDTYTVSFPAFSMVLRETLKVTESAESESETERDRTYRINSEEVEGAEFKTYSDILRRIFRADS